uniref:Carboxypeptidase n=1 Tax=Mycena chlorophos TaxID=658473 RepID=A0ABQ0LN53_MYCCL|nr:predicted protein [Mycena chlorophos]
MFFQAAALLAALLGALMSPALASQAVFNRPKPLNASFAPLGALNVLSETQFTTLQHPAFPNYGVRVKKSDVCDGTVASYTGYIDIEARHIFFYFFESRSDPDTDDVIFWTNGGPGCSSSTGLFMELGPCRVYNASNGPVYHPESWNSNANIFFVDQPIHVGFSYADYGEYVSTTEDAAQDIAAFVAIFFAHFTKFQGRAFHMAGESYGGRYVPAYAAAVYDQNAFLVQSGLQPINLTSIMVGNGMTDVPTMMTAWYDMQCSSASVAPVQTIETCVAMKTRLPSCRKWLKESCQDIFDDINCSSAMSFCMDSLLGPYTAMGLNTYDVTNRCDGAGVGRCYAIQDEIVTYLNKPEVQALLGVDPAKRQFEACSPLVSTAFGVLQHDLMHGSTEYIVGLLERGVRALIYAGSYDFICNNLGNEVMTLELEWSGQAEFVKQPLRDWLVDGKRAGHTRSASALTFATIDAAGHLAPYDKPKESLEMAQRWIAGRGL